MKKSKLKKFTTIKWIVDIVTVLILVVYISTILIQRVSGNNSVLGYRMFNVASESMIPVYKVNDVIAVKDCNPDTLKVGDDIAYMGHDSSLDGKIITHRIIKIEDNKGIKEITTKGINNDLTDPPITMNQILGKVVGVVPFISAINHLVMTQAGFFFLIFVPVVLIACMEIADTVIESKIAKKELIEIKEK